MPLRTTISNARGGPTGRVWDAGAQGGTLTLRVMAGDISKWAGGGRNRRLASAMFGAPGAGSAGGAGYALRQMRNGLSPRHTTYTIQGVLSGDRCHKVESSPVDNSRHEPASELTRRQGPAVGQNARHRKEVRATPDFVQNHKTALRFERQQGVVKTCQVPRVFQVEHRCRPGQVVNQLSRQSGFADLPGPEDGHHRIALEAMGHGLEMATTPWKDRGVMILEN